MKFDKLLKLAAAAAAVAGIAFLVVKYMDKITEWFTNLCPCKDVPVAEEVDIDDIAEEVPVEEPEAEEEVIAEDVAEEAPAEEVEIPEGEPVAEETDFEP